MGTRVYDATKEWEVIAEEELSISAASASGLTAANLQPARGTTGVQVTKVTIARIQVESGNIRVGIKATPTASVGYRFTAGDFFDVLGANDLNNMRMISESGTAKVYVTYGAM